MQTYTHAILGATMGAILFPDNLIIQGSCAAGAMVPDLIMVPQYLIDVAAGHKPMTSQSRQLILLKEFSHSIPIWILTTISMFLIFRFWPNFFSIIFFAGAIGGLSHPLIDSLTHTHPRFAKDDVGMLWPLKARLRMSGWDYRKDYGDLTPKLFEILVLSVSLLIFIFCNMRP